MRVSRSTGNVPRQRGPYKNKTRGQKRCPRCERTLPSEAFGLDRTRDDGMSGWCRACRAASEKARRDADLERTRAELRARYRKDPRRFKAHVAVARAVASGRISKPAACPVCCRLRRVEAHHHCGYSRENWLNVVWCCRQCHALEHKRSAAKENAA